MSFLVLLANARFGQPRLLCWSGGLLVLLLLLLWPIGTAQAQETFTVTTADEYDSGDPVTLREAIEAANSNQNPDVVDVIEFALSGTPPFTLALQETTLPDITEPVRIDATTQPGYDGTPLFVIDGSGLPESSFGDGLVLSFGSDGSEILGLSIVNFSRSGIRIRSDGNTIGGAISEGGNVISGNAGTGIELYYANSNQVQGNYIGTDPSGATDMGNGDAGVAIIFGSSDNVIGGATGDVRNVISGNGGHGISLMGGDGNPDGNTIAGNYIGTDADGTEPLPNGGNGIFADLAFNTSIGGTTTDAANRIAFNGSHGIAITGGFSDAFASGNAVRRNHIFGNTGIGIDLGEDGATDNDAGDADDGPNNVQNFPVMTGVSYSDSQNELTVTYQVPSDPTNNVTYPLHVDFYLADADQEEGEVYLGTDTYTTENYDGGPEKTVAFTPLASLTAENALVATATDEAGNTSEFSAAIASFAPEISVTPASLDFGRAMAGDTVAREVTVENTGNADLELTDVSIAGTDADAFAVTDGGAPVTVAPSQQHAVTIEFVPVESGTREAQLTMAGNAGSASVNMTGAADKVDPQMSVSPSSVDFGRVVAGEAATQQVTVENTSDVDVDVTEITIAGPDPDAFTVAGGGAPVTLTPDQQHTITVEFSAEEGGTREAELTVTSNAGSSSVDLMGTAIKIDLDPSQISTPRVNEPVDFTIAVPQDFAPETSFFYYRPTGTTTYERLELQPTGDGTVLAGTIPGDAVTVRGIDFYAEFSDGALTVTYPQEDPAIRPARLPVQFDQLAPPGAFEPNTYRMIALPAMVDEADLASVFADYGAYEPKRWRVLRWDPQTEAYVDLPALDDLPAMPGRAFWVITRDGEPFTLGTGRTTDASEPRTITLDPGWNQVGNPYAFPVDVASLDLPGSVEGPVQYDGQEYRYDVAVLEPWTGYFMYNDTSEPITVPVPPVEANEEEVETEAVKSAHDATDYTMQITAQLDDGSLRDTRNVIGLAAGASVERDRMDYAEAPPVGDHVRLSILEGEEWLAGSFKPPRGDGQWWDLELTASVEEAFPTRKRVQVRLHEQGRRPEEYERYIIDRDAGAAVEVENGTFTVELTRERPVRRLRVILGTSAFAEAHAEDAALETYADALLPNHPNPFTRATTIPYQIRTQRRVVIEVFNLLGQRVRTLVDATQKAGAHAVQWDGQNAQGTPVSSGIYICRMRAGSYEATRKLVLVR